MEEKLADSYTIYSRILWDNALDKKHFIIGFTDRISKTGFREKALLDWNPDGDIPWHRVMYIRCGEVWVWDRKNRIDLFKTQQLPDIAWIVPENNFKIDIITYQNNPLHFKKQPCVAHTRQGWTYFDKEIPNYPQENLKILTWNILKNTHFPEITFPSVRLPVIISHLKESNADIIALQEVTKEFYVELLAENWVKGNYFVSDLPNNDIFESDTTIILSKIPFLSIEYIFSLKKRLLIAEFLLNDTKFFVSNVHLTSDMSKDAPQKRTNQMDIMLHWANNTQGEHLILGDFNADTDERKVFFEKNKGFEDVWKGKNGFSYNLDTNPLAKLLSHSQKSKRIDAIYLQSSQWQCEQVELYAQNLITKEISCSDHFGILGVFQKKSNNNAQIVAFPTHTQALVWNFEDGNGISDISYYKERIQAIRARYDDKYERWQPHINLIYGFIPEEFFEQSTHLISEILKSIPPFDVIFEEIAFFEQKKSVTAWLKPNEQSTNAIKHLQKQLQSLFPNCTEQNRQEQGYNPHLKIGEFDALEQAKKALSPYKITPIRVSMKEISLISRNENTPFETKYGITLGTGNITQHIAKWQEKIDVLMPKISFKESQTRQSVIQIVEEACKEAITQTVQVEIIGSEYLGTQHNTSDVDLVCIIPKEVEKSTFLEKLKDILAVFAEDIQLTQDAQVPVLKFKIQGVAMDILVAQSPIFPVVFEVMTLSRQQHLFDALSWQIIVGRLEADIILENIKNYTKINYFKDAIRCIKSWAKARCLVGNIWGLLGSYSWTVLVTNAFIEYQKTKKTYQIDEFLRFFFKYYNEWNWENPISLSNAGKSFRINEKKDRLPIITSVEPCFNSAKNITKSTSKFIKKELKRAFEITQKPTQEWENLLENFIQIPPKNAFKVVFYIEGKNLSDLFRHCLESFKANFVGLMITLEQNNRCEIEFLPNFSFLGIRKAQFDLYIIPQNQEKIPIIKEILEEFVGKNDFLTISYV